MNKIYDYGNKRFKIKKHKGLSDLIKRDAMIKTMDNSIGILINNIKTNINDPYLWNNTLIIFQVIMEHHLMIVLLIQIIHFVVLNVHYLKVVLNHLLLLVEDIYHIINKIKH